MSNRLRMVLGFVCLMAIAAYAADVNFAGNWKGDVKAAPPPAAGAPGAGAGGGAARGGGGRGGGFGVVSQKISLNLKQSKDNKLSGNITIGSGEADDVKEGRVEGERFSFSAGRSPQPIYAYSGEMQGDELLLTRIAPAGGRGPRTTEFVLTKKK
jgi:hypothetical protein